MAVSYRDLLNLAPPGVDYWVNPQYQNSADLLARLHRHYRPQNVPFGAMYERAPNAGIISRGFYPQFGVREFARQQGVEDLLNWNQDTKQVTLGGIDVPYTFGLQGRTYANLSDLYSILEQLNAAKKGQKKSASSGGTRHGGR